MNETEIYFARQNKLWNFSLIFSIILLLPELYILFIFIIQVIKDKIRKRREKKENGR